MANAVPLTFFLLVSRASVEVSEEVLHVMTRRRLLENLERFFGCGHVAQQLLDRRDLAVTGGFLLATIRGEKWEEDGSRRGDLDLIMCGGNSVILPEGFQRRWSTSATNVPHLRSVTEYEWTANGALVQLLETDSIDDYVGSFDLAFCRNYYQNGMLKVMDLDAVIHQRCVVDVDACHLLDRTRLPVDIVAKAKKVRARLHKYRARGYTVDVGPSCPHLARILSAQTHTTLDECATGMISGAWKREEAVESVAGEDSDAFANNVILGSFSQCPSHSLRN